MNRKRKIDELLRSLKDKIQNDPNFNIDSKYGYDYVYNKVIFGSTKVDDQKILLNQQGSSKNNYGSIFDNWIKYFKDDQNLKVSVSPNWEYFCQFNYKHLDIYKSPTHLKMYIPLDYDHIEEGAKQLFEFLSDNNILHTSKISKKVRSDDIVIRVINPEDADKIVDYVNNNPYIQEGLLDPIPFAFSKDRIAFAADCTLSYNEISAALVTRYLSKAKNNNKLYRVGYSDFYNYVINEYEKEYLKGESSDILEILKVLDRENHREECRSIISLIIKSQKSNFSYEDLINHYKKTNGYIENIDIVTKKLIEIQEERFGSRDFAVDSLELVLETGNCKYLTRNNGLRDYIKHSNYIYLLKSNLDNNKIKVRDYINSVTDEDYYLKTY